MTPEAKVKARVKKVLDTHEIYHFSPATGGYGRAGVPDIICCFDGLFVGLEIKSGSNKPTALQEREMQRICEAGGNAYLINEEEVDKLDEWITLCRRNKENTRRVIKNLNKLRKKMEVFRAETDNDGRC